MKEIIRGSCYKVEFRLPGSPRYFMIIMPVVGYYNSIVLKSILN